MSGLKKRVCNLETAKGKRTFTFLYVDHALDGGIVYKGKFYESTTALLRALSITQGTVQILSFPAEDTASELLAQAEKVRAGRRHIDKEMDVDASAKIVSEQAQPAKNEALQMSSDSDSPNTTLVNTFIRPYDFTLAPQQEYADRPDTIFGGEDPLFEGYDGFPFWKY